jgi:hypothetical protein
MNSARPTIMALAMLAMIATRSTAGMLQEAPAAAPAQFANAEAANSFDQIALGSGAPALDAFAAHPVTLETVAYEPRPRRSPGRPYVQSSMGQLHAGFFRPSDWAHQGFVIGMRGGPIVDPNLQVGVAADWEHRGQQQSLLLGNSSGPGGTVITAHRQLSSSSENTFPMLAFVQLSLNAKQPIRPYAGIGGGYEIVTLSATDYLTNSSFNATYGGWGWQAWAGARFAFQGNTGLMAEVYMNQCEAGRDVYDPVLGITYRETVPLNGAGARFGLTWGM